MWLLMPCSLVDRRQAIGGTRFLHQDYVLKTEVAALSKMLIPSTLLDVTSQETEIFTEPPGKSAYSAELQRLAM